MNNLDSWLSDHGKELHFPKLGITKQAGEARDSRINATAGVAYNDEGDLLTLDSVRNNLSGEGNTLNYAQTPGLPELRTEWKREMLEKNPSLEDIPTTLPTVTNGLTAGINIAGQLFLDNGGEVITPDMYWDNYELMLKMGLKGEMNTVPTFNKNEGYNVEGIAQKVMKSTAGKIFLVLNIPNNPTGYSPTIEEQDLLVDKLVEAAGTGQKIVVLSDDAYFGLNYEDNVAPESIFAKLADAHENIVAIKIDGATKEKCAWGLRVGFITVAGKGFSAKDLENIEDKISGAIRATASSGSRPAQEAILKAMQDPNHKEEIAEVKTLMKERHLEAKDILTKNEEKFSQCFKPMPANSGYFITLKLNEGIDGELVRQTLLSEHNIGIVAVDNWIRVAFSAVPKRDIPELLASIYDVCEKQL